MLATHYTGVNKLVTGNTMGSIYLIRNTVNGKCYVGQTVCDIGKRIHQHLESGNRGSKLVYQASQKYGIEAFTVEILHDGILDFMLDELEIQEIKRHNTLSPNGYNLETGGHANKSLSPETRRKISVARIGKKHTLEARQKIGKANIGRTPSKATRLKMSASLIGNTRNKGKKQSAEHIRKRVESREKKSQS